MFAEQKSTTKTSPSSIEQKAKEPVFRLLTAEKMRQNLSQTRDIYFLLFLSSFFFSYLHIFTEMASVKHVRLLCIEILNILEH